MYYTVKRFDATSCQYLIELIAALNSSAEVSIEVAISNKGDVGTFHVDHSVTPIEGIQGADCHLI